MASAQAPRALQRLASAVLNPVGILAVAVVAIVLAVALQESPGGEVQAAGPEGYGARAPTPPKAERAELDLALVYADDGSAYAGQWSLWPVRDGGYGPSPAFGPQRSGGAVVVVPAGRYFLALHGVEAHASEALDLPVGASERRVEVPRPGEREVRLRVVDERGTPIESALLEQLDAWEAVVAPRQAFFPAGGADAKVGEPMPVGGDGVVTVGTRDLTNGKRGLVAHDGAFALGPLAVQGAHLDRRYQVRLAVADRGPVDATFALPAFGGPLRIVAVAVAPESIRERLARPDGSPFDGDVVLRTHAVADTGAPGAWRRAVVSFRATALACRPLEVEFELGRGLPAGWKLERAAQAAD